MILSVSFIEARPFREKLGFVIRRPCDRFRERPGFECPGNDLQRLDIDERVKVRPDQVKVRRVMIAGADIDLESAKCLEPRQCSPRRVSL